MKFCSERAAEISAALLICAAVCLGGGSQDNAAPLALAELLSLPVLVLAIVRTAGCWEKTLIVPAMVILGLFLIPIVQLIPLPPNIWTHFPGRSGIVDVLRVAASPLVSLPLSLTPDETAHCALALIPPVALFLITRTLGIAARARVTLILVALALGSIFLGLLEVAQGQTGGLRFYRFTSGGAPVGFFADYDHLADFLACAIPLAAGSVLSLGMPGSSLRIWATRSILLVIPILTMGVAVTGSRAGFILGSIGLAAALIVSQINGRRARWTGMCLAAVIGLIMIVAAVSDRLPALARFAHAGPDLRFTALPFVVKAARIYWPLGSGVGSFVPIFQTVQPTALVSPVYLNHAHDEFLEATLESGVAAWVILALFFVWWIQRGIAVWQRGVGSAARLAQVGFVVVGMILLHATVDFPLRTVTLMGVFAFACALMTPTRKATTENTLLRTKGRKP